MSVSVPTSNEVFTVRTYKHADVAIDNSWANSYEIKVGTSATLANLRSFMSAAMAFEAKMCLDTTVIDRGVVSTWVPDGEPYNPASFAVLDYNTPGEETSPAGTSMLSLDVCLHIRRIVDTGRFGKLFLRGLLTEGDIQGRAGTMVLTAPGVMNTRLAGALTDSGLSDYFLPGAPGDIRLVMARALTGGIETRLIEDMLAVNAKNVKLHHKYFDRA